jgi:MFS family permease
MAHIGLAALPGILAHCSLCRSELIDVGYLASVAVLRMGLIFGLNTIGKIFLGFLADQIGPRTTLVANFVVEATALLLALRRNVAVAVAVLFVFQFGFVLGAPIALVPLLIAEVGLKRFGSISGLTGIVMTGGAVLGPIVAGRVFDVTKSNAPALVLFSAVALVGALATVGCGSYEAERLRASVFARRLSPECFPYRNRIFLLRVYVHDKCFASGGRPLQGQRQNGCSYDLGLHHSPDRQNHRRRPLVCGSDIA